MRDWVFPKSLLQPAVLSCVLSICPASSSAPPPEQEESNLLVINSDGAWSWFEDERAILSGDWLIVGSVASGREEPTRKGSVEVVAFNWKSRERIRTTLHSSLEYDDHNSPALLQIGTDRLLAAFSRHGSDHEIHLRFGRLLEGRPVWDSGKVIVPSETSRVTYSNLHLLSAENGGKGRLYNFFRGLDNSFKPSFIFSDDEGQTWQGGSVLIDVPGRAKHRPYVKYRDDGTETIHLFYTEAHPRDFDNSVYHVLYRNGSLSRSDGSVIHPIGQGLCSPDEGTRIFQGDSNNVAWVSDLELDLTGQPCVVYTVQKDSAGLPVGQGGEDFRYRYACWREGSWEDFEIAYGGNRLYAGEDDYTGNLALDPADVNVVYASTNVHPLTGVTLASGHHQMFRGVTEDGGRTWHWAQLTRDSESDNLRPIVPRSQGLYGVVLWLRGQYRSYTDYDLEVVALPTSQSDRRGRGFPTQQVPEQNGKVIQDDRTNPSRKACSGVSDPVENRRCRGIPKQLQTGERDFSQIERVRCGGLCD